MTSAYCNNTHTQFIRHVFPPGQRGRLEFEMLCKDFKPKHARAAWCGVVTQIASISVHTLYVPLSMSLRTPNKLIEFYFIAFWDIAMFQLVRPLWTKRIQRISLWLSASTFVKFGPLHHNPKTLRTNWVPFRPSTFETAAWCVKCQSRTFETAAWCVKCQSRI